MIELLKRYWKLYLKPKYRIVEDDFAGYECQQSFLWFFWNQMGFSNTHSSIDNALVYINRKTKNKYVFTELNKRLYEECR